MTQTVWLAGKYNEDEGDENSIRAVFADKVSAMQWLRAHRAETITDLYIDNEKAIAEYGADDGVGTDVSMIRPRGGRIAYTWVGWSSYAYIEEREVL